MRRRFGVLATAFAILAWPSAYAAEGDSQKKVKIPEAASLIGKTIDDDTLLAISEQAKMTPSDDWEYGFSSGAEGGLNREADASAGVRGPLRRHRNRHPLN